MSKRLVEGKEFTGDEVNRIATSLAMLSRKQLPVIAAMWVQALIGQVQPVYSKLEDQRIGLLDDFGEKLNDGSPKVDKETGDRVLRDEEGFRVAYDDLMKRKYMIRCKPLPANALQLRNGDLLVAPVEIAGLFDCGLISAPQE